MLRAVEHARQSEYVQAITCIDQILKAEPDNSLALFNKGFTLRMAGHLEEARTVFNILLQVSPLMPGIHYQLGMIATGKGELTEALNMFTQATRIHPFSSEAWFELGVTFFDLGKFKDAKDALVHGSVFDPENPAIWDQIGLCYQQEGKLKEAIRSFDHALEITPGDEQVLFHRARVFEQIGDRAGEIECYDILIKENPENIYSWLKKGLALMLNEEYERSLMCFSMAARLENPGHMPFLLKGLVMAIKGKYEESITCLKKACRLAPLETDILLHLGRTLESAERHQEAITVFNQVLDSKPDSLDAYEGKVRALFQLEEWEELCRICADCRARDPKNHVWYLFEAKVRGWHSGESDSAMNLLTEGRSVIQDDEHLDLVQADLAVKNGELDLAISILLNGINHNPRRISGLYRLARIYTDKGDHKEAAVLFEQLHQLRPDDIHILRLTGEEYEKLADYDTALERYTSALMLKPDDPELWLSRARIFLQVGNFYDALLASKQATSLSEEWFDAWLLRGHSEIECSRLGDARRSLTCASVIQPDNPECWRLLGDALIADHEGKAACIAYDKGLAIDFSDHTAREGKIQALRFLGEWEEAIREYDVALSLKGENFWDLYGKGMILMDIEREDEAEICLKQSERYSHQDSRALYALGNAWADLTNFSRADEFYALSLEVDPENAEVWNMRGHTLRDAGDHTEAIRCFDQALELDPEDGDSYVSRESCTKILRGEETAPQIIVKNRDSIMKDVE